MSINDSEIEDTISHLGEMETDEDVTTAQADVASGTTPYTLGFRKSLKITNGNQTGGAGASDYSQILTRLEAQDIANSGWNYKSSSSFITLSFWVKSSVAQDFKCYLRSRDGTERQYPFSTGSLTANTWTRVVKTIPGNSNVQFNDDSGQGLFIVFVGFPGPGCAPAGSSSLPETRRGGHIGTWGCGHGGTWCYGLSLIHI